jgi:hypothetical protein
MISRFIPRGFSLRSGSFLSAAAMVSPNSDTTRNIRHYQPSNPDGPFPYTAYDLTPQEPGNDASFYRIPRFVTHVDDNALGYLQQYYAEALPGQKQGGRILDFCSSWVSHYPPEFEKEVRSGNLEILGMGMNKSELAMNPVFKAWTVQDLNEDPDVKLPQTESAEGEEKELDASTCVVSIDYLTRPLSVLTSLRHQTVVGGTVHLAVSNRCFPSKVVGKWLGASEAERLDMVGDYLWWSGWRQIEIVTVVKGSWTNDPLWVVRGTNMAVEEAR